MENVRKHERYKTCHNKKKKKLFGVRTNLSQYNFFSENSLAQEMRKTQILMNKSVYLGLSILNLSKTMMYEY